MFRKNIAKDVADDVAKSKHLATERDVYAVFRVFLGRNPNGDVEVQPKLAVQADSLVGEILASLEFQIGVLGPLNDKSINHLDRFYGVPDVDDVKWLADRGFLPKSIIGSKNISWRSLYAYMIHNVNFKSQLESLYTTQQYTKAICGIFAWQWLFPNSDKNSFESDLSDLGGGVFSDPSLVAHEVALEVKRTILPLARSWGTFDDQYYLEVNPDVGHAGMSAEDHFLIFGMLEDRRTCRLLSNEELVVLETYEDAGSALHPVISHCKALSGTVAAWKNELATKFEIDSDAYIRQFSGLYPTQANPLEHYLTVGSRRFINPDETFNEISYLSAIPASRNIGKPAIVHCVENNMMPSAFASRPTYWTESDYQKPDSIVTLERFKSVSFFARHDFHFSGTGSKKSIKNAVLEVAEHRLGNVSIGDASPEASIIIPVYGQIEFVLSCLDSLASEGANRTAEIIIYDDCSPLDTLVPLLESIPWVRYIRGEVNLGFTLACNAAAQLAKGRHIVLLNSDTRVCAGWLDELLATFDDPAVGLVGSKLFNADGSLQEAGGIVWADGSAWNFGRNDDPNLPIYCFARPVDYCSGAAIAIPKALWDQIGGFDELYAPAYYEDTDLAFKVRGASKKVIYQPLARVIHYDGKTHGTDENSGLKQYQRKNKLKFCQKWEAELGDLGSASGWGWTTNYNRSSKGRALFIDALVPQVDKDSGSITTLRMMEVFQLLGYEVWFCGAHNFGYLDAYHSALNRAGIGSLQQPSIHGVADILKIEAEFDVIVGFRYNVLDDWFDAIRSRYPQALLIFHNMDLHWLRQKRQAEMLSDGKLMREAEAVRDREVALMQQADSVVVTSEAEVPYILADVPTANVIVYPYTSNVRKSLTPWAARRDVVFVGGYRHPPNSDAAFFLIQRIWPKLKLRLPAESKLLIVGSDASQALVSLASETVKVVGHVPDLVGLLDQTKVMIAPLQFGAGVKGKVVTGLSNGIPIVASRVAVEGMNAYDSSGILVSETIEEYVDAVVSLFESENLWISCQQAGYKYVDENYSWTLGKAACNAAIETANKCWIERRTTARIENLARISQSNRLRPPV